MTERGRVQNVVRKIVVLIQQFMSVQKRRIGIFCRMPEDDRTCLFKMFRVLGCVRAYVAEGLYGGQKNIFFSGKVSQNPSIRLPTRSSMIGYGRLAIFVPNSK